MPEAQPGQEQRMEQVAWLVECPKYHPGEYFALCDCGCGRHHWTPNVHKATKFPSKKVAETTRGGDVNCVAVEHMFGLQLTRPTADLGEDGGLVEAIQRHIAAAETHPPGGSRELVPLATIRAVLDARAVLSRSGG